MKAYKFYFKNLAEKSQFLFSVLGLYHKINSFLFPVRGKDNLILKGRNVIIYRTKIYLSGNSNTIKIADRTKVLKSKIVILGNNNLINIGENCRISENADIYISGSNCKISIGNNSTFNHNLHLCIDESFGEIIIDHDCMFANNIIIRTSDSHPIYDINSGCRLNSPGVVKIHPHVWVAPKATIMKGVTIYSDSIISYQSVVTKDVPSNVIVGGIPAKVIKTNVNWGRHFNHT